MHFFFASVAALAASAAAAPSSSAHVLHERRSNELHESWTRSGFPVPHALVPVRIGMTQTNLDKGHDLLMEVSEFDSPKYGKHYTEEEIHDLFAPTSETVDTVRDWLESAGVAKDRITQSYNKQWIQFDAMISELEDLLKTKYQKFTHETNGDHISCDEYHVPEHVQPHIDYITPGVSFMPSVELRKRVKRSAGKPGDYNIRRLPLHQKELPVSMERVKAKSKANDQDICGAVITPDCIRALYQIPASNTTSGNVLGIFEGLGDHYAQGDLNNFFAAVSPNIPKGTHPVPNLIDGAFAGTTVARAGPESNLDFSIAIPLVYPANTVLYQTDDEIYETNYVFKGFLNNFFDAIDGSYCTYNPYNQTLPPKSDPHYPHKVKGGYKGKLQCGKYKATKVISISYGGIEYFTPYYYQKRQCMEIMKLGMQGISVVVSSGDYGVASFPGAGSPNGCLPPGKKPGKIFAPAFPATCPYITVLGSTYLPPGGDVNNDEEVATTRFPSGGGFSNLYPQPRYQKAAVQNYLTKYPPPYKSYKTLKNTNLKGGRYNSIGRGYPDFAAVGDNILIYVQGRPTLIGGTSASTPAFASILALINQERKTAGKGSVGFVNSVLYANPQVFKDITVGKNPGCGTDGFAVKPGWDPVTGLGTPIYPAMRDLFLGLP